MKKTNWITYPKAAKILKEPEEKVKQLVEQGIIHGCKENNIYYIDKDQLIRWMKRRKEPRVQVAEIYTGIRRVLLEHHKTIFAKEQAQHAGTRGALYESLVRDFLKDYLPRKFYFGSGQVLSSNPVLDKNDLIKNISKQMDIVIFDALNHPILLPKYELFPIEGTLSVIEVKSYLDKDELLGKAEETGALENIESAKRLVSLEAGTNNSNFHFLPPLGIIFAFGSAKPETIAKHWKDWNKNKETRYRADMICLLEEETVIIDSSRFKRLFDDHQMILFQDPLNSSGENKLVGLKSPEILLFFINLLLKDLRKMVAQSESLSGTTSSSYVHDGKLQHLFTIENAIDPHYSFSEE